jgi:hypothetical protein
MRQWTQEERLRQAQLIRNWRPWEKSAGAKTEAGKAASKMNAYKHGGRSGAISEMRDIIGYCRPSLKPII